MKKGVLLLCACLCLAGCSAKEEAEASGSAAVGFAPPGDVRTLDEEAAASHDAVALPRQEGDEIIIRERLFVAQTNDIYINPEDYLGKKIRYEGIFKTSAWGTNDETTLYYVIRYGPGCCGYDNECGFEVMWPEGTDIEWPEVDVWVEVVGTIEHLVDGDYEFMIVRLNSLTVKEERGAETVTT